MQRVEDFQTPIVTPDKEQEAQYAHEWTPHYGILVGGWKSIQWNRTGEDSIGHHFVTRRVWMPFVRLQVGIRNEFDGALDMPEKVIQVEWAKNDARRKWKSPRACAGDVLASFKEQGYCVPAVLIGHPDPQSLADKVWPREVRDNLRLFQQIDHFENFQTDNEEEAKLASELLDACYVSRNYVQEYVRTLKDEIEGEKGLRNLNDALKELFYEVNEPLPEQKTALVAQAMGKEIVQATKGDNRKDELVVNVLTKLNDRLDRIEERLATPLVENPNGSEAGATTAQTSNTKLRADGTPDRRYKGVNDGGSN